MSFMSIQWLIFSCAFLSFYPAVHFLSIWLSGIIVITNSNGDRTSHCNIRLWILISYNYNYCNHNYFTPSELFIPVLAIGVWVTAILLKSLGLFSVFIIILLIWEFFSINWWSFSGVWVTVSLHKYPGYFSVFWHIIFPILPVRLSILWWLYQAHRLQLVSLVIIISPLASFSHQCNLVEFFWRLSDCKSS